MSADMQLVTFLATCTTWFAFIAWLANPAWPLLWRRR